eukprot:TRINITY_DN22245_c0_g1_i2.p1 TRINITY_DN22245_c0_g1~~TRINITY_DN22245_c0_g1_i2.p1  ORF type:complete len:320 (+),score=62.60 TRINITY_DN22245_c0_g1_i2:87-1046(+)
MAAVAAARAVAAINAVPSTSERAFAAEVRVGGDSTLAQSAEPPACEATPLQRLAHETLAVLGERDVCLARVEELRGSLTLSESDLRAAVAEAAAHIELQELRRETSEPAVSDASVGAEGFPGSRAARVAALRARLAETEKECERLRAHRCWLQNELDGPLSQSSAAVRTRRQQVAQDIRRAMQAPSGRVYPGAAAVCSTAAARSASGVTAGRSDREARSCRSAFVPSSKTGSRVLSCNVASPVRSASRIARCPSSGGKPVMGVGVVAQSPRSTPPAGAALGMRAAPKQNTVSPKVVAPPRVVIDLFVGDDATQPEAEPP